MKRTLLLLVVFCCAACSGPRVQPVLPVTQTPSLQANELITSGGVHLPVRAWLPATSPTAVIIALHGMNDYSNGFALPGEAMSRQGIAVYAYDQRGFGASPNPGIWAGEANLVADLRDMMAVMRQRYPHTPLFILGESMGGAVAIAAASSPDFPHVEGIILSAPAVWGGMSMNPLYRASLWTFAQIMPDKILTGQGLHIMASDNIPMLRALGRDPLVQKRTRMDSVLGLVRLMDKGNALLQKVHTPLLVLYGKHDQVIPPEAVKGALGDTTHAYRFAYYPEGYHLLLRDLHRDVPTTDIVNWIGHPSETLPSGFEKEGDEWRKSDENTMTVTPGFTAWRQNAQRITK